jgi:hypothetical protein
MSKQLMRTLWTVLAAVVMVVGTASVARADDKLVARVPFDFIVGNVRMPAGNYVVMHDAANAIVTVVSADRKHSAFVLTNGLTTNDKATPELVFDKYGSNAFLAKIVSYDSGREIPLSPSKMKQESDRLAADVVVIPATVMARR